MLPKHQPTDLIDPEGRGKAEMAVHAEDPEGLDIQAEDRRSCVRRVHRPQGDGRYRWKAKGGREERQAEMQTMRAEFCSGVKLRLLVILKEVAFDLKWKLCLLLLKVC